MYTRELGIPRTTTLLKYGFWAGFLDGETLTSGQKSRFRVGDQVSGPVFGRILIGKAPQDFGSEVALLQRRGRPQPYSSRRDGARREEPLLGGRARD